MYSSELLHFKLGKQENSDEKLKQAKYYVNNTELKLKTTSRTTLDCR